MAVQSPGGVDPHLRFVERADFAPARSAASLARSFAIRSINFTGTGCDNGKRMVPFDTM
jgi:hypothetical protein